MGGVASTPRSKSVKIAPERTRGSVFGRFSFRRRTDTNREVYKGKINGNKPLEPVPEDRRSDNGFHVSHLGSASMEPRKNVADAADGNLCLPDSHKRKRSWRGRKSISKPEMICELATIEDEALISMHDVHNILNEGSLSPFIHDPGNMLVIDARDKHSFNKHHIVTAKHISALTEQQLTSGYGLAQYIVCVIYDNINNNNSEARIDVVQLREKLVNFISGEVYVMRESYDVFNNNYKFLCTDKVIETAWERKSLITYPSVIIDDKLYQGRGDQATNDHVITNLKITHIVNISTEHANRFERKVIYLRLQLEDVSSSNILKHFEETSDFIQSAIGSGGRVLVHCNLGISRSSAVSLAFLMRYNQWPLDKAYEYLKGRRSCVYPNRGFLKQLSDWEASVLGDRRTNIDYL